MDSVRRAGRTRETEMKFDQSHLLRQGFVIAVMALGGATCAAARADYLCDAPPTAADRHACELARLDRPDELRRFIQRTASIYSLYMPDYVAPADVARWDMARSASDKHPVADMATQENKASATR
jgi:hypothetical protein